MPNYYMPTKSKAYRHASERHIRAEAARVIAEVNERRIPLQVWRPSYELGWIFCDYGVAELVKKVRPHAPKSQS